MKQFLYLTLFCLPLLVVGQTTTENFVKTTVFKGPGGTQPSSSVTYFDGLGRPIQSIAQGQSASGNDIITHTEYDAFGRQEKEYLPYVSGTNTMTFDPSGQGNTMGFYSNSQNVQDPTAFPFSQKQFEASPLNRVLKQAAPGDAWQMGSNHEIKLDYQTNGAQEVKRFDVATTWNSQTQVYQRTVTANSFYDPNQLYKTTTIDENNTGLTNEFKDKEGRVVLKQTFNNGSPHDTYYVYDIYGNLTYVIPPLANGSIAPADLDGLCYQYKYDYRNRLVEKKLPGKQWEFIVYDKLDRVVATGPTFSPFPDLIAQGKTGWMITKYDVFNRPVYTAWEMVSTAINTAARVLKQSNQNSATILNESKTIATTLDGIAIAYTNNVAPTNLKLLTVNYYDDYNYPNAPQNFNAVFGEAVYYNNTQKPKGMPTGSWVRVLERSTATRGETSYSLYDYKARPIRSFMQNYLGGYTQVDSKLDFMGKTLFTETRHKRMANVSEILVREDFTYTAQDRLLRHTHKINNRPPQTLVNNQYTELGQLKTKFVGQNMVTHSPLQKVDYRYNIRGWLAAINDITNLQQPSDVADLFSFKLNYEAPQTAQALFNGNISETFWRTASDNKTRKYAYQYDHLNRLTNAQYSRPGVVTPNSYGENLTYDSNGNIKTLSRFGDFDDSISALQIDKLTYFYGQNGNRLDKVTDITNSPSGFRDDSDGTNDYGDDYSYDLNGNMTRDENKKIDGIAYNHLNLPTTILFAANNKIDYLYNAVGIKVKKQIFAPDLVNAVDYLSGFQYQNNFISGGDALQFFPHAEGYVKVNGTNFNYVYNYTDHLGNIRLSYGLDQNNVLRIIEENNYYPFGLRHKNYNMSAKIYYKTGAGNINLGNAPIANRDLKYNYKYNGKELQDELGLNMYDYGARNYDPAIGRWMNIDVLAENYMNVSGYTYCLNNPTRFIDPTGMAVEEVEGGIRFTEDDAKSAFNILSGKSKNAFIEVVSNDRTRASMNNKNKNSTNGVWSVFAVKNLGIGAKMLDVLSNSSLDNLVVSNHGGTTTESFFEYASNERLTEDNSITTSEITSFNAKGGVNLTVGEKEVLSFVQMGNKVKNGGNFVFAFCSTGKGDVGQQTLSELKTLLGDRMNIFLPRGLMNIKHGLYPNGEGFIANYKFDSTTAGWLRSTPGIKDATTIGTMSISSSPSQPLKF